MEQSTVEAVGSASAEVDACNREVLHKADVFTVSLCGSPGSGKTSLLEATVERLRSQFRIAVIVGNLAAARDATRLKKFANYVADVQTAELDASRVRDVLTRTNLGQLDLLFIDSGG